MLTDKTRALALEALNHFRHYAGHHEYIGNNTHQYMPDVAKRAMIDAAIAEVKAEAEWGPIVPPWEVLPGNPPGAVAVSVPSESIGQCLLWINNAMGITGMASDPDLAADVAKVEAWLGQQKGDGDDNH